MNDGSAEIIYPNEFMLLKSEAIEYKNNMGFQSGVILSFDNESPSGIDMVIFGTPTAMELLWLSEQLRLKAMYKDDE